MPKWTVVDKWTVAVKRIVDDNPKKTQLLLICSFRCWFQSIPLLIEHFVAHLRAFCCRFESIPSPIWAYHCRFEHSVVDLSHHKPISTLRLLHSINQVSHSPFFYYFTISKNTHYFFLHLHLLFPFLCSICLSLLHW